MSNKRIAESLDEFIAFNETVVMGTISTGSSMRIWRPEEVIGKVFMMNGDRFEIKDFIPSKESFYAQVKREVSHKDVDEEAGIIYANQRGVFLKATYEMMEQILAGKVISIK